MVHHHHGPHENALNSVSTHIYLLTVAHITHNCVTALQL